MDRQLKYDRTTTTMGPVGPETLTVKTIDLSPFKFTLTDEDNKIVDIANENICKKLL